MFRDILANKWILGSIALMIIVAVSCYFWYQHELSPYKKEFAESAELLRQMELPKVDTDNLTEDETKTPINDISANEGNVSDADIEKLLKEVAAEGKVSNADVEKLLKEVAAEEKEVTEVLSAEEMAKRENKRKAKELWEKIGKIMQNAGGSIHSATHPEEMQEIVSLLDEAAGGSTIFTQMNNFGVMFQNSVNSKGEIRVSEVLRMADYYESEMGELGEHIDLRTAAEAIRNMALYATIKGYDVINLNEITKADDFEEVLRGYYESTNDAHAPESFYHINSLIPNSRD